MVGSPGFAFMVLLPMMDPWDERQKNAYMKTIKINERLVNIPYMAWILKLGRLPQKERIVFQPSIFRGKLAISFREGTGFPFVVLLLLRHSWTLTNIESTSLPLKSAGKGRQSWLPSGFLLTFRGFLLLVVGRVRYPTHPFHVESWKSISARHAGQDVDMSAFHEIEGWPRWMLRLGWLDANCS